MALTRFFAAGAAFLTFTVPTFAEPGLTGDWCPTHADLPDSECIQPIVIDICKLLNPNDPCDWHANAVVETLHFDPSGSFSHVVADFADDQGTVPAFVVMHDGVFRVAPTAAAGEESLTLTYSTVTVTPLSEANAAKWNFDRLCERADWQRGVAVDVTGLTCDGAKFERAGQTFVDPMTRNDRFIRLEETAEGDRIGGQTWMIKKM